MRLWPGDQRGSYVKVCVVFIQQPRGPSVWANDFFTKVLRGRNTATKKPGSFAPAFLAATLIYSPIGIVMHSANPEPRFVICISNKDYPASLEVRKIYQVVSDANAAKHQMIRVIDESNEDYLYPISYFVPVELPKAAEEAFSLAS